MTGKTHMSTGLTAGLGLLTYELVNQSSGDFSLIHQTTDRTLQTASTFMGKLSFLGVLALIMLCIVVGTLLPDIDSPDSMAGRFVPILPHLIPHRGPTHTIWAVGGLFAIAYFWGGDYYGYILAGLFGYIVHLIADSFSVNGLNPIYPIDIGLRLRFRFYRTDGAAEHVWHKLMLIASAILTVYILYLVFIG